ncbi:MAG: acyltransferase family protein [Gammaproteobacteria bacterium]|nr:acyltransferase family protein [Gammaproteobacteria bacterium]
MTNNPSILAKSGGNTIPSLDGIRALAIIMVFFAHSGLEAYIPGGLGVTIFFVLSGYLITTLMRMEYDKTGCFHYRGFYLRRLLRLMPPLFIVVLLTGLLSAGALIDGQYSLGGLLSVLFYVGNYHVIVTDFHGIPAGLGVIWSLAIEEQYYLLYPPLLVLLFRIGRRHITVATLSALFVAVLGWRYWLVFHGGSEAYLTMATDTRFDALLTGCLLAVLHNPWLDPVSPRKPRKDWLIIAGCIAILLGSLVYRDEVFRLTLRYTLQNLAIAPLLYLAVARSEQLPFRWLNSRPLMYIGTISYTVYLSHHVILLGLARHWPELGWAGLTLVGAVLTLVVAEPMRRWVEQPCAGLRKRLHQKYLADKPAADKFSVATS